ncbi:MAG: M23 family metallopeptidase [Oscillospiraceae bacterium]|nr:M23 family metallopeptidase [Oscillospiraceae bacterium]
MNNKNSGKKNSKLFISKGFYISLVASIIAVGIASYLAINKSMDHISKVEENNNNKQITIDEWVNKGLNDVDNSQSGVEYSSSSSSSSSKVAKEGNKSDKPVSENTSSESKATTNGVKIVFAMPINGDIINNFSSGELIKSKTLGDWRTHDGIDIKSKMGTPVKSIGDGKVIDVTENSMWGTSVIIEHTGGFTSYYNGLSKSISVKKDQIIKMGDVIGGVGDTAEIEISEESHLHFALKKDKDWVDPMKYLTKP